VNGLLGGEARVEPVGEVSAWSGTWLVRRNGATHFLKRTPRCRPEPLAVAALSRLQPQLIPAVITTDVSPSTFERWFLLADAGECDHTALSVDVSMDVALRLGALQRRCAAETGLSSLFPTCVAPELRDVALSCCRWALTGEWPPADREFLRATESALVDASGTARRVTVPLARLPPTVVHGDMWAGNIARSGGRIVFVDWGSALWGVGAVHIVNLVVCRPSALDVEGEAAVWSAYAEGLGVPLDDEFRRASHVATPSHLCSSTGRSQSRSGGHRSGFGASSPASADFSRSFLGTFDKEPKVVAFIRCYTGDPGPHERRSEERSTGRIALRPPWRCATGCSGRAI
jgi:hypothetical protein